MHEHKTCKHTFKFCEQCDTVYCEKCKTEWDKSVTTIELGDSTTTGGWTPNNALVSPAVNYL